LLDQADQTSLQYLKAFREDPSLQEGSLLLLPQYRHLYYGAVRAGKSCLGCHQKLNPDLAQDDLLAVVKIEMSTKVIERCCHDTRALLISTAVVTALLMMGGSCAIARSVTVKPVKHLKEVADAISAGELNVRSEIQTSVEFEDLSHAFNRMLRNL